MEHTYKMWKATYHTNVWEIGNEYIELPLGIVPIPASTVTIPKKENEMMMITIKRDERE